MARSSPKIKENEKGNSRPPTLTQRQARRRGVRRRGRCIVGNKGADGSWTRMAASEIFHRRRRRRRQRDELGKGAFGGADDSSWATKVWMAAGRARLSRKFSVADDGADPARRVDGELNTNDGIDTNTTSRQRNESVRRVS
jgi:hypothetical protein